MMTNNMEVSHFFPQPFARFRSTDDNNVMVATMNFVMGIGSPQNIQPLYDYLIKCGYQYAEEVLGIDTESCFITDFETIISSEVIMIDQENVIATGVFGARVVENIARVSYTNDNFTIFAKDTVHNYKTSNLYISSNELIIFPTTPIITPSKIEDEESIFIKFNIRYVL